MNIVFIRRSLALFGFLLVAAVSSAAAQDAPLRKSDLVRMLSGSTYSMSEVAAIVQSNCLSFAPTDRDISDFQDLGADGAVLAAVRGCADDAPTPPSPSGRTFEVEPLATRITAPVGTEVLVTVIVRQGGQPYGGLEIVLRGSGNIEGGPSADRVATSGADGRATLRVPAGSRATRYPLTIAAAGASLTGTTNLALVTTPGAPAVLASPSGALTFRGGALDFPILVEDAFGNPVPAVDLAVAGLPNGAVIARGTTESDGRIAMVLEPEILRGVQRLVVSSAEGTVGEVEIRTEARGVTMAFVAGMSQTGVPGEALAEPVTVEVYDLVGDPAAGVEVTFTARNGRLDSGTLRTGRDGRASVRVIAGSDASRPVEIRARSGSADAVISLPILSREGVVTEAMAQGERRLSAGDPEGAVTSYRRAVDLSPANANAWVGLGEALVAAGRPDDARFAFEQALAVDPGNLRAEAALAAPELRRSVFGADVWGGSTLDSGRDAGIRYAEVRFSPTIGWLDLRGTYDDALNLRQPWLKRGADDLRGFSGGVDLHWGRARRLTTTVELGRREQPISDIAQNTYLLAQGFRLANGGSLRVGGWVGRWFDRDDYVVFGEGRFPTSRYVTLLPSISYGDDSGSNVFDVPGVIATGRSPETEIRGGLRLRIESPDGWGFEPGIAVGSVTSDLSDEYDGSLLDVTTRAWTRLGAARIQGYVQYQSPPGTPAFWTVALGLGFDVRAR